MKSLKAETRGLLKSALLAEASGRIEQSWELLAEAHILSQPMALLHLHVHWRMWGLAWRTMNLNEIRGQFVRLFLAVPGSLSGKYPKGNTGRSNVSMFLPMEIPEQLRKYL